ncbi:MAG: hypothetical protein MUF83_14135 [Acidimicrobiales bacterium]|nr:hypothetical protein [Acidimicrobiales bacterium]
MNDDRAAEGVDHLQAAALEMIAAARAFLDVVEEVVSDRDRVADIVGVVGDAAEAARRAARSSSNGARAAWDDRTRGDGADEGVEHIRVS